MSTFLTWLAKKLLTQAIYQKLLIHGLRDVALPLAKKTNTNFDDNVINEIIKALK